MNDQLDRVLADGRALLGKISKGPWRDGQNGNLRVYGPDNSGDMAGLIAVVYKGRANAEFIVWCRNHLLILLDMLEAIPAQDRKQAG